MIPSLSPAARSFVSQRLKLSYLDWGNEGAPLLVLLHGGRDHARSWDWTAEALRDQWHVVAPDLRGHGDSDWSPDADYTLTALLYDFAQFIHQLDAESVSIVAHSLGGAIALRYTGLYPAQVRRVVAIEGLGLSPAMQAERAGTSAAERLRTSITQRRALSGRTPRRYPDVAAALARMREENAHLTLEQALHLTLHGVRRNEDGTYSWKFDNYIRSPAPVDLPAHDVQALWGAIACPTLLLYGEDSGASDPDADGRLRHFNHARVERFAGAGHWLHHDRFADFLRMVSDFLE
jgi:pimeloyl-ACP methyl ester carboxylesterase